MDVMSCNVMQWMWCDAMDVMCRYGCDAMHAMNVMWWMWCNAIQWMRCDRCDAVDVLGCNVMWHIWCDTWMWSDAMLWIHTCKCNGCDVMRWLLRCDRCDIMLWIYHITHYIHRNTCIHRIHSMESHRIHRITSHSSHRIHIINHIHRITPPTLLVNLLTYHVHFYNTFVFFTLFDEKELLYIKILTVINFRFYHYHLKYCFWWVLCKEYVWVLTGHHQTVEHCKNWYLFVFSEHNDSRKQDNRNPNK